MARDRDSAYELLKNRLATMSDLRSTKSLLFWDRQTYMPGGGVAGRAEQMATMSRLSHEMLTDSEMARLLEAAGEPDPSSEEGALLRRAWRDYDRATRLPTELVAEISRATSMAEPAWVQAREKSDWSLFAPHLEKVLSLERESAEHLGYEDHPYDVLLDAYEPGAKTIRLTSMFEELKKGVVPLISAVVQLSRDGAESRAAPLYGGFSEAEQ